MQHDSTAFPCRCPTCQNTRDSLRETGVQLPPPFTSNLRSLLAEARPYIESFAQLTKSPAADVDAMALVKRIRESLKVPDETLDRSKPQNSLDAPALHHLIVVYGDRPGLPYAAQIVDALKELQGRRAGETSGELEQLRRIDKAARAYVDSVEPGSTSMKQWEALLEALYNGSTTVKSTTEPGS